MRWVVQLCRISEDRGEGRTRLVRALMVREQELKTNEEMVKKRAQFRSESLRDAMRKLRATIAQLMGEGDEVAGSSSPEAASVDAQEQKPSALRGNDA